MNDITRGTAAALRAISLLFILILVAMACSDSQVASPTETTPDGTYPMVMYDCEGDCDEPAVSLGGMFYVATLGCEPIASDATQETIAVPDPDSPISVPYSEARVITGIDRTVAVAIGPESPPGCDQERSSWWAAREQSHLYDEELGDALRSLTP